MLPATLEKLAFGLACVILYLQGRLSSIILAAGILDLILALLFLVSYRVTAKQA